MVSRFLQAQVGKDNEKVSVFLDSLPPIGCLYTAPPNFSTLKYWGNKISGTKEKTYQMFLARLRDIFFTVKPNVFLIEVRQNKAQILEFFCGTSYVVNVFPIRYSCPNESGDGWDFVNLTHGLVVATDSPVFLDFQYKYSHEFLGQFFRYNPRFLLKAAFDPCIGRGLLVHFHPNSYGIEISQERLTALYATYQRLYGDVFEN